MQKRTFISLSIAVLGLLFLTGCGDSKESSAKQQTQPKEVKQVVLRIGAQPYPLYSSIFLAKNLGYLEEELKKVNATFQWTEFKAGPLVNEAVAAGNADIGFMADMPAILAKSSGQDIQIIANIAYGEKALALIVKNDSEIGSVADLKGKKVAYVKGSYAQHLLSLLLNKEGLSFNDIESVNITAGDIPATLENKQIDAAIIWEQFISSLVTQGKAKVIADGTGIKKGNMITYSVKKFAEENPKVIEAYIKAGQRASEYIKTNPKEAAEAIAKDFKIEPVVLEAIFKNLTFNQALSAEDIAEITKVKNYLLAEKAISNDIKIEEFVNTKYLQEAGIK